MIKVGGLIDISAPASGILLDFKDQPGAVVKAGEQLAAIKNLDELYKNVLIKSPASNIKVMRTYVEKGNFVKRHQLMMVLAKDIYYEANVDLVASEVNWLKTARDIEVVVHPNTDHAQKFAIASSRIEIPDQRQNFYHARLKLACGDQRCEDTALAGAIVKVVSKNTGAIMISRNAIFNNDQTVAVLNGKGEIEHREIVKGKVTSDSIEVLSGLTVDEKLVVKYNREPTDGEKASVKAVVISQFASL